MMKVRVRPHVRRRASYPLGSIRRERQTAFLWRLAEAIRKGERKGYTYTTRWAFDIDDHAGMQTIYRMLGDRTMYVVAITNRRLEETDFSKVSVGANFGVGFWRDDDGTIYADDITLFLGPKASRGWALQYARKYNQKYILAVDGPSKSYEFIATGVDVK